MLDPDIPAAARAHTPAGAEAFVRFALRRINEVMQKPAPGELTKLATPTCRSCQNYERTASVMASSGQRYSGPIYDVGEVTSGATTGPTTARVYAYIEQLAIRVVDTKGRTCFPDAVPRRHPAATRADHGHDPPSLEPHPVRQARRAYPTEGKPDLVTLPTYFEVTWPSTGFQPGETNTVTLLGHQVRIRPTLQGYTYQFGDGTGLGPTTSPGGPYPTGDITHAYPKPGAYPTRVDITYGGQFSINGGEWITIPDTVTITGPAQTLTVKAAKNRLVNQ